MGRIEIDVDNMCAIIEPGVTHAQLQAEAMKVGLFNGIPLVGAHAHALANHVWHGMHGPPTGPDFPHVIFWVWNG